jgi:hypothetical protein
MELVPTDLSGTPLEATLTIPFKNDKNKAFIIRQNTNYKLLFNTFDTNNVFGNSWSFTLLEDPYEELCNGNSHSRSVPVLIIERKQKSYLAKEPGRNIDLCAPLDHLEFRVNFDVTDCKICDIIWLRATLKVGPMLSREYYDCFVPFFIQ